MIINEKGNKISAGKEDDGEDGRLFRNVIGRSK